MAKIIFDSEKELEDMIVSRIEETMVCPVTGNPVDAVYQQLPLSLYGITDIVTTNYEVFPNEPPKIYYTIIEIKKEVIKIDAVAQLARYMRGLSHTLSEIDINHEWKVNGILVAPDIDLNGDTVFLCDQIDDIDFYKAIYSLDKGLDFKEMSGWYKQGANENEDLTSFLISNSKEINAIKKSFIENMEAANG